MGVRFEDSNLRYLTETAKGVTKYILHNVKMIVEIVARLSLKKSAGLDCAFLLVPAMVSCRQR